MQILPESEAAELLDGKHSALYGGHLLLRKHSYRAVHQSLSIHLISCFRASSPWFS